MRKGLAPLSVKTCIGHLSYYLNNFDLEKIDDSLLTLAKTKKPSYINCIISSLRNYGHFTKDERLQQIPYFKIQDAEKGILSDEEIEAFLDLSCPEHLNKVGKQSYEKMTVFWRVVAFSGARCGEIAPLDINHIDFGRNLFLVNGKTGKRNIPINPLLLPFIKSYIKDLKDDLLFKSSRTQRPIDRATWHWDFHQRLKRLGIKRERLTPHSLRHSFITRLLDEDVNLFKVQKIVGHRNIVSTARYTHLTTKDLQRTIMKDRLSKNSIPPIEVIRQIKNMLSEFDDPRFGFELTDKGLELLFRIEFLGKEN